MYHFNILSGFKGLYMALYGNKKITKQQKPGEKAIKKTP